MNKISLETKNELDIKFLNAFERQVIIVENKNIKILAKYYKKNYDQGISNFLKYNTTNYESLFTNGDLEKEYQKMYISIGNHIAQWYFQIFKKYQTKADSGPYESEWEKSFATYGSQVAATNVTGVNGTAKKTLVKLTQQLMKDPEFMQLGNEAKARVLRKRFNHYSNFQAQRLVRTESTRAANFAIEKSSQTLFSENDLSKKWLTIMDGKERPWHRSANGQTVRMNESFVVGGEFMFRPGEGSARNVINCRCRILPIPDEGAMAITELDEIGVGLGRSRIEDFSLSSLSNLVNQAMTTIGAELVNSTANTIKEFRTQITKSFEDVGFKIGTLRLSSKRTLLEYNRIQNELDKLFKTYNYNTFHNNSTITLKFKSTRGSYGYYEPDFNGKTVVINLGDRYGVISRTKMAEQNMRNGFDLRFKSVVDANKVELATPVHEMAHTLINGYVARKQAARNISNLGREFFDELQVIRTRYRGEIRAARLSGDTTKFNNIYLGEYASTNIDEFFAEAWTEFHLSSTPSPYALEIGKLVNKYYGK